MSGETKERKSIPLGTWPSVLLQIRSSIKSIEARQWPRDRWPRLFERSIAWVVSGKSITHGDHRFRRVSERFSSLSVRERHFLPFSQWRSLFFRLAINFAKPRFRSICSKIVWNRCFVCAMLWWTTGKPSFKTSSKTVDEHRSINAFLPGNSASLCSTYAMSSPRTNSSRKA